MCGYFGTKKKSGSNRGSPLNSIYVCLYLNIGMCGYFGTKKKSGSNRGSPLNSSIDIYIYTHSSLARYFAAEEKGRNVEPAA